MKKNQTVFLVSILTVILLVLASLLFPAGFKTSADSLFAFITTRFAWLYMLVMTAFLAICLYLVFSRFGSVRLGKDDERPQYSNFSWFAMLFSAGMGVALVFWGIAEPLNHWLAPLDAEPASRAAARFALKKTIFHWGFHPWANYAVLAVGMAYVAYRREKSFLLSTLLEPLIGTKHAQGGWGKFIDILAIFATVGGVATSFGLAALQFAAGLKFLWGIPSSRLTYSVIIVIITLAFLISAITGINKGIKWLSNINVILALLLMLIALIIGSTVPILNNMLTSMGDYLSSLLRDSLEVNDSGWYSSWTVFYWAWSIAWAPFVAPFIARISRGRTIREFVLGVILVPSILSAIWFSIFGTIAISQGVEIAKQAIASTDTALFVIFNQYHLGAVLSVIAMLLLGTFYVTSADSATFVLAMLSSEGTEHPSTGKKLLWGIIQAGMALGLIISGGKAALSVIQTSSIVASFPFMLIMVLAICSFLKMLRQDFPKKL